MAAIMILWIISQCFVISEAIGTRNTLTNTNETDTETGHAKTVQDGVKTGDINGHVSDNVNSSKQQTLVEREAVSGANRTEPAGVSETQTLNETLNITENPVPSREMRVEIGETTQETTYRMGSNFELPSQWTEFCYVTVEKYSSEFTPPVNLTVIRCNITIEHSGVWKLKDLREHLNAYNSSDFKYSVDIECFSWSKVSIPWPMKVANMYSLIVKHCQITNFLSEFKEELIQTTLDSLRVLDLSDNQLLVATDVFIDITTNVKDILPEYNCGHDSTLETMSLRNVSYNFIDSIDVILTKLTALESIDVVLNRLTALGEQFILDARRLPVRCDYQHLMYLDEGQSTSMSIYHTELKDAIFYELRVYNLSHSYIKVLKDKQLQWSVSFPKLVMYDLSHNHISKLYRFEIPLHAREDQITTINLQYNRISSFSVEDLDRFKKMPTMFIDLRNNPIDCNCTENMKQLLTYIRQKKYLQISNLTDYSYIKDLKCAGPKDLQSRTLSSITDLDVLCKANVEKEYFLVPILILSCTIVVLSIILLVLLRYRKEVLIILFTRFNIIVPCQHRHRDDSTKTYDAFVSYSSKEEDWVEDMFEKLEQQLIDGGRQFRFCLHHRDFIPGKTIFDNVIKSVENSRHTIILLSNNFLKSEFCLYEFQEAFRQSIMEQKRHLVIVMMEELDADKLPRDLRRCIKTFTYIRKDDYLFRERLIYALSVKQKQRVVESKKQKVKYTSPKHENSNVSKTSSKDSRPPDDKPVASSKTQQSNKNDQQLIIDNVTRSSGNCKSQINQCNGHGPCENESANTGEYTCSSKFDKSTAHFTDCVGNEKRNNAKRISEKGLALSIENEVMDAKAETDCEGRDLDEDMDKFDTTEIPCVEKVVLTTDYDRSISTVSRDTGYFSEKGSPDICSVDDHGFDKNIFSNTDDIDITDFIV